VVAAVNLPGAALTASDLSEPALRVARRNAQRHLVHDRVRFFQGSLFEPLPPGAQFDFIVSNPPYIAASQFPQLPPDVRLHEPRVALVGGDDGLDCIRELVEQAGNWLAPGGLLLIEIDPQQQASVTRLVERQSLFGPPRVLSDLGGQARVVACARAGPAGSAPLPHP